MKKGKKGGSAHRTKGKGAAPGGFWGRTDPHPVTHSSSSPSASPLKTAMGTLKKLLGGGRTKSRKKK